MQETQAIIERVRRINDDYQHLTLAVEDSLAGVKPGQSILIRMGESWSPYLREQWWPVSLGNNRLIVERPANTPYEPGQVISVLGLIGQPFRFRRTLRNVLLLAFDTPPTPLLMAVPLLLGNQVSVTVVLLGTAVDYNTQHLSPEVEVLRGDGTLNWPNRVMTVGWADQVFAVVSLDDELLRFSRVWALFKELRADIPSNYLFAVFQPVLTCGVGACSACLVRLRDEMKLTCVDGPALDLSQVVLP